MVFKKNDIKTLEENLASIYARFLITGAVVIEINSEPISPNNLDNWAFPPKYQPRNYTGEIKTKEGRIVKVDVTAGLISESNPFSTGDYGVYFYCNDRLIASGLKTADVGFVKGI